MASSLISALGGLRSHQGWLDVIGNNLANANTPGFKSARALFSSMLARDLRPASPSTGNLGGTNPVQIGLGVEMGSTDTNFQQGALNLTGRTFDVALRGGGFFAVSDGTNTFYTRVGNFGLDGDRNMVDLRTGYRVLNNSGSTFQIDTDAVVPPSATGSVTLAGNLPAEVTGPLAEVLSSASSFLEGTAAVLPATNTGDFTATPDTTYSMEVVIDGGAPQQISLTSDSAGVITSAQAVAALDALDHVSAAVGVSGAIELTTDRVGQSATIKINPGLAGNDLASVIGLSSTLTAGSESGANAATDLNDLTAKLTDYAAGDRIEVSGTDADGSLVQGTFIYGTTGTSLGDLTSFVDGLFGGATASFNATTGQIELSATQAGEADLSVVVADGLGQAGQSDWARHALTVSTDGAGPDTATTSIEVFDGAGVAHLMSVDFERQEDGTWNAVASVPASEGTVTNGTITGITFTNDGALLSPATAQVTVQFTGQSATDIALDLGVPGQFDGLTHFGNQTTVIATDQDGFGVGELSSLQVNALGEIQAFYSNGELRTLDRFGVANFVNPGGMEDVGDGYWAETANSGERLLGGGADGPAGEVAGASIELSNVDTAEEFVRMILAQRGFQANARVITTQDEMLAEIVNVV